MSEVEIRTKSGTVQRGETVVTEKWQRIPAREAAGLADNPNVEVRDVKGPAPAATDAAATAEKAESADNIAGPDTETDVEPEGVKAASERGKSRSSLKAVD